MPLKWRTPPEMEEAAVQTSASAFSCTLPIAGSSTQVSVHQVREKTREDTDSVGRGLQGGLPSGYGTQQGFGLGPQVGGRSAGQGTSRGWPGRSGRGIGRRDGRGVYQGGFCESYGSSSLGPQSQCRQSGFSSSGRPQPYTPWGNRELDRNLSRGAQQGPTNAPQQQSVQGPAVSAQPLSVEPSMTTGVQGKPASETFIELSTSILSDDDPAKANHVLAQQPFHMEPEASESGSLPSGIGPAPETIVTWSRGGAKSTRVTGGGSVRPLPPLKENLKKVMYYC